MESRKRNPNKGCEEVSARDQGSLLVRISSEGRKTGIKEQGREGRET